MSDETRQNVALVQSTSPTNLRCDTLKLSIDSVILNELLGEKNAIKTA